MRKFILPVLVFCVFAYAVYAATQVKNTGAGYQLGTANSQLIGFWGATPVTQQFVTAVGVSDAGRLTNLLAALIANGIIRTN